jgi:hypothetical protein
MRKLVVVELTLAALVAALALAGLAYAALDGKFKSPSCVAYKSNFNSTEVDCVDQ